MTFLKSALSALSRLVRSEKKISLTDKLYAQIFDKDNRGDRTKIR